MQKMVIDEILELLEEEIPKKYLTMFRQESTKVLSKYEINQRYIADRPYQDNMPMCYNDYMSAKELDGMSKASLMEYERQLHWFFDWCDKDLNNLKTPDIRRYMCYLQENHNVQNSTLNSYMVKIKSFFNWIYHEGYIDKNPCANVGNVKEERS